MGQATGVRPTDRRLDKSLTTVADIEAMKEQVQGWCNMVQTHLTDGLAVEAKERVAAIAAEATSLTNHLAVVSAACKQGLEALQAVAHNEVVELRAIVEQYREDELRYRQARTWRGRMRRWLGIPQPGARP